jgi:hypothetical protein
MKYSPGQGTVTIRVRYNQESCIMSVIDTGIGIPQEEVGLVTQRFHRVESSAGYVEGTGMPLARYSYVNAKAHPRYRTGIHLRASEDAWRASRRAVTYRGRECGWFSWVSNRFNHLTANHLDSRRRQHVYSHDPVSIFFLVRRRLAFSTRALSRRLGYDHLDRNSVDLDSGFTYESGQYGKALVDAECQNNSDQAESSMSDAGSSSVLIRGIDPGTLFFTADDILLVVDDNPDLNSYIASLFTPFVRVEQAKDGVEALEIARRVKPSLILSDVSMPRMSGTELLAKIKSDPTLEFTPVILM